MEAIVFEVEIWIDVVEKRDGVLDTVCTLFAPHTLPIRPLCGESLSWHQQRGASHEFQVWSPIGPSRSSSVCARIDDVGHYAVKSEEGVVVYRTSIRCEAIEVPSLDDARALCALMTEQVGFEFDPYAVNRLVEG